MGFLDWLFGRRGEDVEVGGGAEARGESQASTGERGQPRLDPRSALEPLMTVLGASGVLQNPDDDSEFEVRGRVGTRPARVKLDDRPYLECELKGELGARVLVICRDPTKVPKEGDAADPWDDGDVRTFVGKGIYVEGDREQVDGFLRLLHGLSEGARGGLMSAMETCFPASPLAIFVAAGDEIGLSGVVTYEDAARDAEVGLNALASIVDELERLPDPVEAMMAAAMGGGAHATSSPNPAVVDCAYCGSRFVTSWGFSCPNCGAPHRA